MKNIAFSLCFLFLLGLASSANAQMDKKEFKEWKKRKKSMDVAEFKRLVEESSASEGEVSSLKGRISSLESRISDKDAKIADFEVQVAEMTANPPSNNNNVVNDTSSDTDVADSGTRSARGVIFKVQIGAFRNLDLDDSYSSDNFLEEEEDGLHKYTLGRFRDYWQADKFKKYMRDMGVKDAWIVPYKDGTRVPLKDVLEGVVN